MLSEQRRTSLIAWGKRERREHSESLLGDAVYPEHAK